MKLSVKGLAIAAAIMWSIALLILGSANLLFPGYASNFLDIIGSVYPGYHPGTGIASVVIGALYGLVDAAIGGAIFAWLYNLFAE